MKTIFKRTSTHLLIATLAAGMGVHLASLAQSTPADTGQVVITGSISASTCASSCAAAPPLAIISAYAAAAA